MYFAGFKNNYVDVFNPNGTKSSGVNDVPVPNLAPVNAMSSPQVPNMFIPPTLPNSGSDGPVSFLTPPSEDVPPMSDQDVREFNCSYKITFYLFMVGLS